MSIDGIGKRGAGIPATGGAEVGGAAPAQKTGKSFETTLEQAQQSAGPGEVERVAAADNQALTDLKAGRIDLNTYLDRKVESATSHLQGFPAEDLLEVRRMLREQIVSDPAYTELVERATGKLPTPPED